MAAIVENLKSQAVTNLDTVPIIINTAGQGASGRWVVLDDYVSPTSGGLGSISSTYRLCRFPTGAVPKQMWLFESTELDTHSLDTLVFDINIAFSDSTDDGTPTAVQGNIPTTANTGTWTTVSSYSSPNKFFGSVTPVWNAVYYNDITFNGSQTTYPMATAFTQPLWQTFGFVDGRSNPVDPGGFFDILVYVSTAATTGASGTLGARFTYAI